MQTAYWDKLFAQLERLQGGYVYSGACSYQVCFPLARGGELRFARIDSDMIVPGESAFQVDVYSGAISPGVTGFTKPTGPAPDDDYGGDCSGGQGAY